ncbi:major facilitator superfamily transporter [Apiospora saccharicola]|uniref:Major facilitator superfamily transporter n=1 Tax=Apiospora saccharicola TaxID=335842 RepID=A0ABR1WFQ3_9PEZI
MAVEEQIVSRAAAAAGSETAPLLGPAAPEQGDAAPAACVSKIKINGSHGTFGRDTADLNPTNGDDVNGIRDDEPKIRVNLARLLPALAIGIEVKVATDPFAPGHVILHPPLLAAYGSNFFGVAAQMGVFFFIAMFYQAAMALTATQSGLLFVPSTVLGLVGSLGGGLVMKKTGKYYGLTLTGYTILLLSIIPLVLFTGTLTKSMVSVVVGMAIMMLGAGISITTTLIAIIANCAPEDMAMAVACSCLFRSLGTTIGISLSTAVLQQVLHTELAARLRDGGRAAEIEAHVRQSLDYIWTLPPPVAATVRDCYAVATAWAFLPIALLACLCLVSTAFIREKKLD